MEEVGVERFLKRKLENQESEISKAAGVVVPLGLVVVGAREEKFVPGRMPYQRWVPLTVVGPDQILEMTVAVAEVMVWVLLSVEQL